MNDFILVLFQKGGTLEITSHLLLLSVPYYLEMNREVGKCEAKRRFIVSPQRKRHVTPFIADDTGRRRARAAGSPFLPKSAALLNILPGRQQFCPPLSCRRRPPPAG